MKNIAPLFIIPIIIIACVFGIKKVSEIQQNESILFEPDIYLMIHSNGDCTVIVEGETNENKRNID